MIGTFTFATAPYGKAVASATSAQFRRAIVMPNLAPPVRRSEDAARYRDAILAAVPPDQAFKPLMTLYLTETTEPEDLRQGWEAGIVTAVKLYPAGATTNSDAGVRDLKRLDPVFETMAELHAPCSFTAKSIPRSTSSIERRSLSSES